MFTAVQPGAIVRTSARSPLRLMPAGDDLDWRVAEEGEIGASNPNMILLELRMRLLRASGLSITARGVRLDEEQRRPHRDA